MYKLTISSSLIVNVNHYFHSSLLFRVLFSCIFLKQNILTTWQLWKLNKWTTCRCRPVFGSWVRDICNSINKKKWRGVNEVVEKRWMTIRINLYIDRAMFMSGNSITIGSIANCSCREARKWCIGKQNISSVNCSGRGISARYCSPVQKWVIIISCLIYRLTICTYTMFLFHNSVRLMVGSAVISCLILWSKWYLTIRYLRLSSVSIERNVVCSTTTASRRRSTANITLFFRSTGGKQSQLRPI